MKIHKETFEDVIENESLSELRLYDAHTGFREDYLTLQVLLRKYEPKSVFEVGTNTGEGVVCIRTALPKAEIFSLDLDYATMKQNSAQYPLDENGKDRVGSAARHIKYTQIRQDSMVFDFSTVPCEAYFIDGEHDYTHAYHEAMQALSCKPKIIIFHDSDVDEVMQGIQDAYTDHTEERNYTLNRVVDTRIAYLLRK